MLKKLFFAILAIYLIPAWASAPHTSNVNAFLDQWRATNKVTSVIITVEDLKTGKQLRYTSGSIENGKQQPPNGNTLYCVGSISKLFASAALLNLQTAGKINLDSPIGPYFPEYPRWKKVTVRQLLNMSSGIPEYMESKQYVEFEHSSKTFKEKTLINLAYQQKDYFKPGTGWRYSNTNYLLATRLIQKITRQPLLHTYQRYFLTPLKLKHTYYSNHFYPLPIVEKMAHAYADGRDITHFNASLFSGAGSMLMSQNDLLTWAKMLLVQQRVLNAKGLKELKEKITVPRLPPWPKGADYGLGIFYLDFPKKGPAWWYTGVIDGYTSAFVFFPRENQLIVAQAASFNNEWILFPTKALLGYFIKSF